MLTKLLVKVNGEYLPFSRIVKVTADDKNHGVKTRIMCKDNTNNGCEFLSILRSQLRSYFSDFITKDYFA